MDRVKRNNIAAYFFLSPAILLFGIFTVYPFLYGLFVSLNQWDGFSDMKFIGLRNYAGILKDELFYGAMSHNAIFAVSSTIGKVGAALFIALLLNRKFKGVTLFRGIFFTPMVISCVAIGVLWQRIYDPNLGLLDMFLMKTGVFKQPVEWLADPNLALFSLVIVDMWRWTGYHIVLFLAGLQTIPRDVYESSEIDGTTRWQQFRYITLPQLSSITLLNITISMMGAFSLFDLVYIMTKGGPYHSTNVLLTYMYDITFGGTDSNFGYGSSVAYILFAMILVFTVIQTKIMNAQDS